MKPHTRPALLLLACLAAAAPARAAAQPLEAWVLPRGLLELDATGIFTHFETRLGSGNPGLGDPFLAPYTSLAGRLTADPLDEARSGLRGLLEATTDPEAGVADSLDAGSTYLRLRSDHRIAPITFRYGLTSRLTVSLTVPFERHGTSSVGPLLLGGTVGVNTARDANRAALEDLGFGDFGGGLLLPLRDSPAGRELQSRLRELENADTLRLPTEAVTFAQLLQDAELRALVTDEEAAALGLASTRSGYTLGDVELGVRFLLRPGPRGWPDPDTAQTGSRTALGLRARLPTGGRDTTFLTEVPSASGHAGVGVDVVNELFLTTRWSVRAAGSVDLLLPADVEQLAFAGSRPFPADTALRTLRREPGPRASLVVAPRWRLTRDMSFFGEYAFAWQGETNYSGPEGVIPTPLESLGPWTAHAFGIGGRYSTLNAYAAGETDWPFEVSVSFRNALFGSGLAPDAGSVRLTARFYVRPSALRRRGAPADTLAPPATPPADTLPAQQRPPLPGEPEPDPPAPAPTNPPPPPPPFIGARYQDD